MQPPSDLTIPGEGSTTARQVLGGYLKRTLADLRGLPLGRFDSRIVRDFAALRAIVEGLFRSGEAGLVYSMLRRPTLSTLIRCIERELWSAGDVSRLDAWLAEVCGLMALELADTHADALTEPGIRLARRPVRFVSPSLGVTLSIVDAWAVTFAPGRLVLEGHGRTESIALRGADLSAVLLEGVSVVQSHHEIVPGLQLALVDNNPLSSLEAHPEKEGNAVSLGDRPVAEWTKALGDALRRIEAYLPDLAREIRLTLQLLVPVGYDPERHVSASYAESVGTAYVSLHPDPMTMTEAVIHEFSHNKLNALHRQDPILENAFTPLFSSPVRPDPRPLLGVLLAVHAFTPVARLYELMLRADAPESRSPAFNRRYRQIVQGNHEAVATLTEHGRATPVGRALLDELRRWDDHYRRSVPVGGQ